MNVYDFDDTIYDGDSSIDFLKFCIKKNKKCLLIIPIVIVYILLYKVKLCSKEQLKTKYFSFVKYFNKIDDVVIEFWESKNYKLKDFYINGKKDTDIIISASPMFLLKPVAKYYGFKLIATDVDKKTGKLIGKNCHDSEKVRRINELGIKRINNFYSDSLSDAPLAKISKNAYIVKGEKIVMWSEFK